MNLIPSRVRADMVSGFKGRYPPWPGLLPTVGWAELQSEGPQLMLLGGITGGSQRRSIPLRTPSGVSSELGAF